MGTLLQDLRYGARMLRKSPGFTIVAVLTLALGIGANTAIFSVVNGVLLRPLPFRDPSRLVLIAEKSSFPIISTSYENYLDWRDQSHSFESMEATRAGSITLTGAGEPERLNVRMATAGLFSMLGINAQMGRIFLAEEDRAGSVAQLRVVAAALRRLRRHHRQNHQPGLAALHRRWHFAKRLPGSSARRCVLAFYALGENAP